MDTHLVQCYIRKGVQARDDICVIEEPSKPYHPGIRPVLTFRPGKKMSWFWSSGGSILTQIKKNAGRRINMTPRKIPSPEVSSPVNHRIRGHLCADMNVLGLQLHLVYILVYFCSKTLILIQVESGSLVL